MKKLIYLSSIGLTIVLLIFLVFSEEQYYIPKPKAKIKIELPLGLTSFFEDHLVKFKYSNSAYLEKNDNIYSLKYPLYDSEIVFFVKEITDLDMHIYNFQNKIIIHEKIFVIMIIMILMIIMIDHHDITYNHDVS